MEQIEHYYERCMDIQEVVYEYKHIVRQGQLAQSKYPWEMNLKLSSLENCFLSFYHIVANDHQK